MIWHKHHVVPRHMGGSNDPSNLVKCNIPMHAFLHLCLWKEHGRWQDEIAWKVLSGQITAAQGTVDAVRRANTGNKYRLGQPVSSDTRKRMSRSARGNSSHLGFKVGVVGRKRMSDAQSGEKHRNWGKSLPKKTRDKIGLKNKISNSWRWKVVCPMGIVRIIENLREFCRQNNLTAPNMVAVSKGKCPTHKGWTCQKLDKVKIGQ